jgi:hypothetical protein
MTAAFVDDNRPRSIAELTSLVQQNAITAIEAINAAYAMGHADGNAERTDAEAARIVRVGVDRTHSPEVQS